jgi:hypothetical protein
VVEAANFHQIVNCTQADFCSEKSGLNPLAFLPEICFSIGHMSPVRYVQFLFALVFVCIRIHAQSPVIVYEDSTNYSGKFNQLLNEYGDEITLAGTARLVTQFQFEYFGGFTPAGDESARVRFYSNTGPPWINTNYVTPAATPLFETTIPVGTGFNTATITVPYVNVPDTFTWAIQFFGITMTPNDTAGLLFYGVPTVGKSFINDYWEHRPNGWTPVKTFGVTNNFAAKVVAVDGIPPSPTLSVAVNGGNIIVSWPATVTGVYLESRPAVASGAWTPVYPQALRVGDVFQATIPMTDKAQIFRLNSQPQPPLTVIAVADGVHIRWSAAVGGQKLQTKTSLTDANWTDVATPTRPVGSYYEVVVPTTASSGYFRLVRTF